MNHGLYSYISQRARNSRGPRWGASLLYIYRATFVLHPIVFTGRSLFACSATIHRNNTGTLRGIGFYANARVGTYISRCMDKCRGYMDHFPLLSQVVSAFPFFVPFTFPLIIGIRITWRIGFASSPEYGPAGNLLRRLVIFSRVAAGTTDSFFSSELSMEKLDPTLLRKYFPLLTIRRNHFSKANIALLALRRVRFHSRRIRFEKKNDCARFQQVLSRWYKIVVVVVDCARRRFSQVYVSHLHITRHGRKCRSTLERPTCNELLIQWRKRSKCEVRITAILYGGAGPTAYSTVINNFRAIMDALARLTRAISTGKMYLGEYVFQQRRRWPRISRSTGHTRRETFVSGISPRRDGATLKFRI